MRFTFTYLGFEIIENNHVGDDWETELFIVFGDKSYPVKLEKTITFKNVKESPEIFLKVIENDPKYDDSTSKKFQLWTRQPKKDHKDYVILTVYENAGRYKDYSAKIKVSFSYKTFSDNITYVVNV